MEGPSKKRARSYSPLAERSYELAKFLGQRVSLHLHAGHSMAGILVHVTHGKSVQLQTVSATLEIPIKDIVKIFLLTEVPDDQPSTAGGSKPPGSTGKPPEMECDNPPDAPYK